MKILPVLCTLAAVSFAVPAFAHSGKAIYDQTCSACHANGVMGAPKFGNKDEWAPRIAKGKAALLDHADYGFNNMPAHGGNDDFSDKDVEAAVDYMVAQAGGYTADATQAKQ